MRGHSSSSDSWRKSAHGRRPFSVVPIKTTGPMFYMFSGPDFLYANAFFPNASTYILCGIEPVGPVPDIDKIPPDVLPSALANLRKSLDSLLELELFHHEKHEGRSQADATQRHAAGALCFPRPRRLHNRFRHAGCARSRRQFRPERKGSAPGVKIVFSAPNRPQQTLYYFTTDLGTTAFNRIPASSNFASNRARA